MKHFLSILLMLALCLLLTACGTGTDHPSPGSEPPQAEAPASDTDAAEAPAPASESDAAREPVAALPDETPEPEEPVSEPIASDALVADAPGAPGQLPCITQDSPGAADINEDIQGTFRHLVDAEDCRLYYETYQNGDILSVVVVQQYSAGGAFFTPYNLNVSTGERLDGQELMDYLNISREIVGDNELAAMAEEFEYMWGGYAQGDTADLYQELYDAAVSTENAEFSRLWLGRDGVLYFAARLTGPGGPDSGEYPLSTGLSY